jgi:hypothetical protein
MNGFYDLIEMRRVKGSTAERPGLRRSFRRRPSGDLPAPEAQGWHGAASEARALSTSRRQTSADGECRESERETALRRAAP